MAQLTENNLQLLDTADLLARAEAIRDAVQAKTISAQQVGQLFCDLTDEHHPGSLVNHVSIALAHRSHQKWEEL